MHHTLSHLVLDVRSSVRRAFAHVAARLNPHISVECVARLARHSGLAVMLTMAVPAGALQAQGAFMGSWIIDEWTVAPWVKPQDKAAIKPNTSVLKRSLIFTSKHIVGPPLLSCDLPKYELLNSPFEGLFEGGLPNAKVDATALGFKAPVKTLRANCDFDFHLRDANTAMFALDNVLYTMKRKNPTS